MSDDYNALDTVNPDDAYVTPEGRLRVVINPKRTAQPALPAYVTPGEAAPVAAAPGEAAPVNALVQRGIIDKLLGIGGPRYQTWPEKMVRSAVSLPAEAVQAAIGPAPAQISDSDVSPVDIGRVLDLTGMLGGGSIPSAALGREVGTLGVMGGKMIQPGAEVGPFYSAVEHAIQNAPQDKMSPGQWLGWLKNQPGVKQEELDWVGLPRNAGAVTKAEMLDHVQGHGPQIKEVEKSAAQISDDFVDELARESADEWANEHETTNAPVTTEEWQRYYDDVARDIRQNPDQYGWEPDVNEGQAAGAGGATRYNEYQLPGGDNYRELLLTMPEKPMGADTSHLKIEELPGGGHRVVDTKQNAEIDRFPTRAEAEQEVQNIAANNQDRYHQDKNVYKSSHWDEPNVLVHMRMNDRTIPNEGNTVSPADAEAAAKQWVKEGGENWDKIGPMRQQAWIDQMKSVIERKANQPLKSLHLEEVQSDWHQQGRKQGYKLEKVPNAPPRVAYVEASGGYVPVDDAGHALSTRAFPTQAEAEAHQITMRSRLNTPDTRIEGVPDAPFKTTWPDLALKRAITKAAREGYDAVSWTPGEQQAARYDLSKNVDRLEYLPPDQSSMWPKGRLKAYDKNDGSYPLMDKDVAPEDLPGVIGKEIAERLLNTEKKPFGKGPLEGHTLEGEGLRVGGEGMKRFYDKMLVDKANAIAKKFGGKVEYKELPNPNDYATHPVKVGHDVMYYVMESHAGPDGEDVTRALPGYFKTAAEAQAHADKQKVGLHVPVLRLTPKMKEAAQRKGMPLFAAGLPYSFTPVDHDPFQDDRSTPGGTTRR